MKRIVIIASAAAVVLGLTVGVVLAAGAGASTTSVVAAPSPAGDADTVYTNGVIYTVDAGHLWAQAVAVKNGLIEFVGTDAAAQAYIGPGTQVVDLKGRMVLPGFIDSHAHPDGALTDLYEVNIYGLPGMKAYQNAIKAFAAKHPELKWIQGGGWDSSILPVIGPSRYQLDAAVKNRPAVLWDLSGHEIWVNSLALKMAGITSKTPNPPGGVIEHFPGTHTPSGTLREAATDLVTNLIPDYTVAQYEAGLLHFQKDVAAPLGLTTVYDASLEPGKNAVAAFEDLAQQGKLTVRYRAALHLDPHQGPINTQVQAAVTERAKHTTDLFQTNSVKLFMDGVIEGHTGLLAEPYRDRSHLMGEQVWHWSDLQKAAVESAQNHFQLHFHAIGDQACSMALNAIGAAEIATGNVDNARDEITHLQLVTQTDVIRFAQLKVIAVPQPYWAVKDSYYYDIQLPFLGKWRADREYPMESFFKAGVVVASGSDYPVTIPPDPLECIATGVMRWFRGGSEWSIYKNDILWPSERCSVRQMIESCTLNGAYANFLENETGSIAVGKSADLVVLSRNISTCSYSQIGTTKVLLTVFGGKQVYKSKAF